MCRKLLKTMIVGHLKGPVPMIIGALKGWLLWQLRHAPLTLHGDEMMEMDRRFCIRKFTGHGHHPSLQSGN